MEIEELEGGKWEKRREREEKKLINAIEVNAFLGVGDCALEGPPSGYGYLHAGGDAVCYLTLPQLDEDATDAPFLELSRTVLQDAIRCMRMSMRLCTTYLRSNKSLAR
jgi:hypothetical protein